ncbi:MAG: hypothetical protein KKI14_03900, partial [Nanoarchaeota archaeon]|nr:hypothetical protein [Nanoarchaeota archaeon]
DKPIVDGNSIIGSNDNAAVTKFGNAIWISKLLEDSEYSTLLKAIISNSAKEWYLGKPGDGYIEIPRLNSLCCDIPEIAETSLVLWYVY